MTTLPAASAREIAVIGGGPKAAAIAAKAWTLRTLGIDDISVTIFEPEMIGAYWSGKSGYTDGEQQLCTIAERDVGYPYKSLFTGREVDLTMASEFSWERFLLTESTGYSEWVDHGRKPPRHKDFAEYLQWVVRKTGVKVVKQRVIGLAAANGRWHVDGEDNKKRASTYPVDFDAAVVTGPGPAKQLPVIQALPPPSEKIFNGQDFWQRLKTVRALIKKRAKDTKNPDDGIVIIGAGGTAAAILSWLVSNGAAHLPIRMVASQASLYTRVDSFFENQLFSDESQWKTLSPTSRRAFFDRLNRGVVWATVIDRVSSASNFSMIDGRAEQIAVDAQGNVEVQVQRGDGREVTLDTPMAIDCSGFDAWWFLSLIKNLPSTMFKASQNQREAWQQEMQDNLALKGSDWNMYPPLHAPMLARELGPGFGSLMVLGAMSDRILRK
nr:SidA/IucD/PvdA family monooxygenase [uncultured Massilia sp.]